MLLNSMKERRKYNDSLESTIGQNEQLLSLLANAVIDFQHRKTTAESECLNQELALGEYQNLNHLYFTGMS